MSNTVYHGSGILWSKPIIGNHLSSQSSLQNEGAGLYFSQQKDVALSYGRYVYTINLKSLVDYRVKSNIKALLTLFNLNISANLLAQGIPSDAISCVKAVLRVHTENISNMLGSGMLSFNFCWQELLLLITNSERWAINYWQYDNILEKCLLTCWNQFLAPAYIFPYNIPRCGVIRSLDAISNITCFDTVENRVLF